jgi:hypothetical protein
MVQRLARGPFKAEIRVRFPLALPSKSTRPSGLGLEYLGISLRLRPLPPARHRAIESERGEREFGFVPRAALAGFAIEQRRTFAMKCGPGVPSS